MTFLVISREEVAHHLSYDDCIPLMREAMIALSRGQSSQILRTIVDLEGGGQYGIMPGAFDRGAFGAKLISVFPHAEPGAKSHRGMVALFDPESGAPACLIEAGELTAIRTAAASAAATDALSRSDARRLAILGTGEQAWRHIEAIARVRPLDDVMIWGRSADKSEALAIRSREELKLAASSAPTPEAAIADADMVCTVTASPEPVLLGKWVKAGTHVNAVGSSRAGPVEIDADLVACSRFFADHHESVLRQGAEFLEAKAAGRIGDDHILGEIGQVYDGTLPGRLSEDDVTIYKSLGNIVQDLGAGWFLYRSALEKGFGTRLSLE
ncbi:MAG TPA: ornithine cyclodeaminase family protein [Allosphingosinicella sp.]|nr:ornithine cyclodeaminase family protein [Allosphingosinicella sp.]